jgi:phage gp36-like protein
MSHNNNNWLRDTKMTYANLEDYLAEFGNDDLPDDSQTRVTRALDRAAKLVDVHVRASGLSAPLTDSIAIGYIKGSLLDISRYFVWSDNPSEEIRKRYDDALNFLESVATGKVRLVAEGQASTGSGFRNIRLVRA